MSTNSTTITTIQPVLLDAQLVATNMTSTASTSGTTITTTITTSTTIITSKNTKPGACEWESHVGVSNCNISCPFVVFCLCSLMSNCYRIISYQLVRRPFLASMLTSS